MKAELELKYKDIKLLGIIQGKYYIVRKKGKAPFILYKKEYERLEAQG